MSTRRIQKINSLIAIRMGEIFAQELEFPDGAFPSIVKVDTSPDLTQSKVFITVVPESKRGRVLTYLRKNIYRIQGFLNEAMVIRRTPRIKFSVDTNYDKVVCVENLLKEVDEEKHSVKDSQ